MPSIVSRAKELEMRFLKYAPRANQDKIKTVLEIYKDRKNVNYIAAQNIIMALSSPSSQGGMDKVQKMYELFLNKHQDVEQYPKDAIRTMRYIDRMRDRRDRLLGIKKRYQMHVALLTEAKKMNPNREKSEVDEQANKSIKKLIKRKHQGLVQFWAGNLMVEAPNELVLEQLKWKLTMRGDKWFKALYPILMTDENFKERELKAPGYLEGVYITKWVEMPKLSKEEGNDPKKLRKRESGEKVAIQYRYCSHELDTSKSSFKEALQKSNHNASEC